MEREIRNTITAEQLARWRELCRPFRGIIWTGTYGPGVKVLRIEAKSAPEESAPVKNENPEEKILKKEKSSPGYDPELEVLCLPTKYGAQMVERRSRPLPTKDGYVQYVNKEPGGKRDVR